MMIIHYYLRLLYPKRNKKENNNKLKRYGI